MDLQPESDAVAVAACVAYEQEALEDFQVEAPVEAALVGSYYQILGQHFHLPSQQDVVVASHLPELVA